MPLSDDGYIVNDLADYIEDAKQRIKDEFGEDTDVSDHSHFGRLATVLGKKWQEDDESGEDATDASLFDFCDGVQLDRLASRDSLTRKPSQFAQATLQITGQAGYLIPEDTEFDTDNGDAFFTDADVQIDANGNATVTVNSEEDSASANVDANTIINQANPVDSIETVNNANPAQGGADLETDYSFRKRLKANAQNKESSTLLGIKTGLLNVNGVTGVVAQENVGNDTDINNNPPHTMHFYVSGGLSEDIFNSLAKNKAGGAIMVGNQRKVVNVDASTTVSVAYDVATTVYVMFKLDIVTGEGYDPDILASTIQDFVVDIDMGENVIVNKLYGDIYNLAGVERINSIEASRADNVNWVKDILPMEQFEQAGLRTLATPDIEVTASDA